MEKEKKVDDDILIFDPLQKDEPKPTTVSVYTHAPVKTLGKAALLDALEIGLYCCNLRTMIGIDSSWINNEAGLLRRKEALMGSIKVVIPSIMPMNVMHKAHYPRFEGHPGVRKMYDTLRTQYWWLHVRMVSNGVVQSAQAF